MTPRPWGGKKNKKAGCFAAVNAAKHPAFLFVSSSQGDEGQELNRKGRGNTRYIYFGICHNAGRLLPTISSG
jgi:hypothetical protein